MQKRPIISRSLLLVATPYGLATVSRIDSLMGFSRRILSLFKGTFAEETYGFIDPTNQNHPIPLFRKIEAVSCKMQNSEHCNTLKHTAAQHTATQHTALKTLTRKDGEFSNALQHTAQRTATHCNTLQHTGDDVLLRSWSAW